VRILDRTLSLAEAELVAGWEYPPPHNLYDSGPALTFMGPEYRPVYDEELVGFVCFGAEARVKGQREGAGMLDVGAGLRPDRVGQRVGTVLMPLLVEYARIRYAPRALRVAVAAFNERSLALCCAAGFVEVRWFKGPQDREFVELQLQLVD
jgi:[ribosomal protein S18]-alanine N-acetyltransferase